MDEEVLVCPTSVLDSVGRFHGFTGDVDRYVPVLLNPVHLKYLSRMVAEDDPTHKQLVPYAVLLCEGAVFCYRRGTKGGEARLHDRLSLGVGGHISREDGEAGVIAYEAGFARELKEEVEILGEYTNRIVGLVHDDSTPVGRVHLGVVHLLTLESPKVIARDPALAEGGFRPIPEIRHLRERFETWSTFVFDHVLDLAEGGPRRTGDRESLWKPREPLRS